MVDDSLLISAWAPGLMGFAFSSLMYGGTLGQSIYYTRSFPHDSRYLKLLVLATFVADTAQHIAGVEHYWTLFILCHRQHSARCESGLSWGIFVVIILDIVIIFIVQCFYCHRIWIISGRNKIITGIILACALLGLAFGIWYYIACLQHYSIHFAFTTPLVLPIATLRGVGDFLITGTVFKYMWRSGFRKKRSAIRDLAVIFINMGAFTCTLSTILGILFLAQGNGYLVSAVAVVLSRSYVNSMLAILNARKTIRDRTAAVSFELSEVVYSFE